MQENLTDLCKRLEHYETAYWAINEILDRESLRGVVIDPCCGAGIMTTTAEVNYGYQVSPSDIHDWGFKHKRFQVTDFLKWECPFELETTIFMNPPFSLADKFVEKAIELDADKIICFQRFSWWESGRRSAFWQKNPPNRIYVCGDRADCWRYDLPRDKKGHRINPKTGKSMTSSPTTHAWYVWEFGHPPGTLLGHIYDEGDT